MSTAARIDELRKKFEENPRRYFAPLANELRKDGNLPEAIALCREFLPKQPEHMSGYIVFGQALYESGEMSEARVVFEQALALDPENLKALRHLGDIARREGDSSAARRWYERVLEADPRNDDIAAQLATLVSPFAFVGEVTEPVSEAAAIDTFEEGAIAPEWPDTTELVSRVVNPPTVAPSFIASRTPDAVMAFGVEPGDSVALPPLVNDAVANPWVAPALEQPPISMEEASEASFVDVVADGPSSAFVTETMGELLVSQGFTARAIPVYEELVRRRPYDPVLTSRLAELREQLADELAPRVPVITRPSSLTPVVIHAAMADIPSLEHPPLTRPLKASERFARLAARRVTRRTPDRALTAVHEPEQGLASLFSTSASVDDNAAARALADAFIAVDERFPLANDLSFGEAMLGSSGRSTMPWHSGTPVASASVPDAAADAFSFDRFFPDPATGSFPPVAERGEASANASQVTPASTTPVRPPAVSDDLAQFSAWLKGLGPS
jgi:tetratricopeptide (TPR) repeat protein